MWEEALDDISIPLWFDYGKEMKERDCTTHQHFNSTMVRLWASIPFTCSVKVVYFNSTMVRLWGNTGFAAYQPRRISIPLWFDYGFQGFQRFFPKWFHFNSTMVRLWAKGAPVQVYKTQNFNSTMVRLWEGRVLQRGWIHEFQFHYGSIMGFCDIFLSHHIAKFQFHYGSIMGNSNAISERK